MKRMTRVFGCETPKAVSVTRGKCPQKWLEGTAVGNALLRLATYEDILFAEDGTELVSLEQLRTMATQTPNPPLTLEELREMGGEPVWMEFCEGVGCWCIVHTDMEPVLGLRVLRYNGIQTDIKSAIKDGRKFYRHKPKEVKH